MLRCHVIVQYNFSTVPQASLDISESTEGSVSGLTHTLTCTATLTNGVLPSLVTISWSGGSLSRSPRVIVSDQTTNGSHYTRTVTFSPLLYNDAGQYNCSVLVDGFEEAQHSNDVMIVVKGMCCFPSFYIMYYEHCMQRCSQNLDKHQNQDTLI